MIWFLRLFGAFTALEKNLEDAREQSASLQATCDSVIDQSLHISGLLKELQQNLESQRQQHAGDLRASADFLARTRFGHPIYDRISELPVPEAQLQPVMGGPRQASSIRAELERQFFKDYMTPPEQPAN